jgi:hypothetical protein
VTAVDTRGALEAVERIVNRGGEPREVVQAVLDALHQRGVRYAVIHSRGDEVAVGEPTDGVTSGALTMSVEDQAFVDRVATLISPYVPR